MPTNAKMARLEQNIDRMATAAFVLWTTAAVLSLLAMTFASGGERDAVLWTCCVAAICNITGTTCWIQQRWWTRDLNRLKQIGIADGTARDD